MQSAAHIFITQVQVIKGTTHQLVEIAKPQSSQGKSPHCASFPSLTLHSCPLWHLSSHRCPDCVCFPRLCRSRSLRSERHRAAPQMPDGRHQRHNSFILREEQEGTKETFPLGPLSTQISVARISLEYYSSPSISPSPSNPAFRVT